MYVVSLKPSCKVFDFRDRTSAEFKKLFKLVDPALLDWIYSHNSSKFDLGDIYEFCNAV